MRGSVEPVSLVTASLQDLMREALIRIGENPDRDGLPDTPERLEHSLQYLTKGYREGAKEVLLDAMFDIAYDEMVIIKDDKRY
jgi:GTP cyclohydrolase I